MKRGQSLFEDLLTRNIWVVRKSISWPLVAHDSIQRIILISFVVIFVLNIEFEKEILRVKVKQHAVEHEWGNGEITSRILNLGTREG
jgi:hypothetical protein